MLKPVVSGWYLPRESFDHLMFTCDISTSTGLKRISKRKFVIVIDQRNYGMRIFSSQVSSHVVKYTYAKFTIWCHVTFGQSVTGQHPTVVNRDHMVRTIFIRLKILKIVRKTRRSWIMVCPTHISRLRIYGPEVWWHLKNLRKDNFRYSWWTER